MRPRAMPAFIAFALAVALTGAGGAQSHKHYNDAEQAAKPAATGQLAPRLQNLGSHVFPVTTRSVDAQTFVNQGVNLAYGFNHAEAGRSFREAARLDPDCVMAYWGQALVLGPNINAPMDPKDEPRACELVQQAMSLRDKATPRERGYVEALATRYSGKAEDRATRDRAYADAMRDLVRRFPDDLDAATLYAEAVMDLRPWGYWMRDGQPKEGTTEIVSLIESVIRRDPNHPGALHFYIHLMEPVRPQLAEPAADRLLTLVPDAGHLVHMPSHIYQRVGRYADAVKANQMAVEADESYIAQCHAQGLYPMGYYPHNLHFLWWAATMDGDRALALQTARKVASKVSDEMLKETPMLAGFRAIPYYAYIRFGMWDDMLREPEPPSVSPFLQGIWHYGRGRALVAKARVADAERELAEVRRIAADKALETPLFSPNTMAAVLAIAPESLAGAIAAARHEFDTATSHFERAVRLDDGLVYTEPAEWVFPPRHDLAAVLLDAGRPAEAETVYWEDLKRNPENGWSLRGLTAALYAEGKADEARSSERRFQLAWTRSDVTLAGSSIK